MLLKAVPSIFAIGLVNVGFLAVLVPPAIVVYLINVPVAVSIPEAAGLPWVALQPSVLPAVLNCQGPCANVKNGRINNKKVVLISGSVAEYFEFFTPYRITNYKVCNGCFNSLEHEFDGSNWLWCPKNKNFECTSSITFEMVKEKKEISLNTLLKINLFDENNEIKIRFVGE